MITFAWEETDFFTGSFSQKVTFEEILLPIYQNKTNSMREILASARP